MEMEVESIHSESVNGDFEGDITSSDLEEYDKIDEEFSGFSESSTPEPITSRIVQKLEEELHFLYKKEERTSKPQDCGEKDIPEKANDVHDVLPETKEDLEPSLPKSEDANDYLKPFQYGWKRELNTRDCLIEHIVYIHPLGLRLRSLEDLAQHLTDGLTVKNFTFLNYSLNAGPDNEIYNKLDIVYDDLKENISQDVRRDAEKCISSTPGMAVRKSGRVPVPSSNYKIVERMEEESRKRGPSESGTPAPPPKREKLVLKIKPLKFENGTSQPASLVTDVPKKRPSTTRKKIHNDSNGQARTWTSEKHSEEPRANCSMLCPLAMGLVPTLQCCVCLCLYHPECAEVGRTGTTKHVHGYVCKSCRGKPEARKPSHEEIAPPQPVPPPPPPVTPVVPQYIISINKRRFVMVPNLGATSAGTQPSSQSIIPSSGDTPIPEPVKKTEVGAKKGISRKDPVTTSTGNHLMRDLPLGYTALRHIFKYLTIQDLLKVSRVCQLWRDLAFSAPLWEKVDLTDVAITNWGLLMKLLGRRSTKHFASNNVTPLQLSEILSSLPDLKSCSVSLIRSECDKLIISALTAKHELEELRVKASGETTSIVLNKLDLEPVASKLRVLSLLNVLSWDCIDFSVLTHLTSLTHLELGDCSSFPNDFPQKLSNLTHLTRIRLENLLDGRLSLETLGALAQLPNLQQMELVNFDGEPDMDKNFAALTNIRSLLIIPKFTNKSGSKITSLLKGVFNLRDTLSALTWVFTVEFLNVTELFVDNYSPSKNKKALSPGGSVPMLMPLPVPADAIRSSSQLWENSEDKYGESGTIAVVPMSDLEAMLKAALPNTEVSLLKMPAEATTKMTLN